MMILETLNPNMKKWNPVLTNDIFFSLLGEIYIITVKFRRIFQNIKGGNKKQGYINQILERIDQSTTTSAAYICL